MALFEDTNAVQAAPSQNDWDAVTTERETGTPAAEVKAVEAPATAAETAEAPVTAEVVDPYAGLSQDVKAKLERFDLMAAEQPKLIQLLKETQGRVSSLQSEFAKRQQAAAAAPDQTAIAAAAKDPEKWEALKKDFPEWGDGIQAFVESRIGAAAKSGMTAEQLEQAIASKVGTASEAMAARLETMLIETKYGDWEDVVKTPEFATWYSAQKPEVQVLSSSPKGRDALRMLDLFHDAKKTPVAQTRQTRQQVLAAAVTGKPGAVAATKTVADMSPAELWNHEAAERMKRAA